MSGVEAVIYLSIILIFAHLTGKVVNRRNQRKVWSYLRPHLGKTYKSLRFVPMGTSGFRILASKPVVEGVPAKLEFTLLLQDRENLLHFLVQKTLRDVDKLMVKANLSWKPGFNLEIAPKRHRRIVSKLESKETGEKIDPKLLKLNPNLVIWSEKPREASRSMINPKTSKALNKAEETILRISISQKEPNLILISEASEQGIAELFSLIKTFNTPPKHS